MFRPAWPRRSIVDLKLACAFTALRSESREIGNHRVESVDAGILVACGDGGVKRAIPAAHRKMGRDFGPGGYRTRIVVFVECDEIGRVEQSDFLQLNGSAIVR